MIRHSPFGRGHPYQLDPDQRVPADPVAGEPIELRATTDRAVTSLRLEFEIDGAPSVLPMDEVRTPAPAAGTAADAHLKTAATRATGRGRRLWAVVLEPFGAGTHIRYRFSAQSTDRTTRTRWFVCAVASWDRDGGELLAHGEAAPGRVERDSIRWLMAPDGPRRVRLSLRLERGSHIVGFGERFDALDQSGRALDAVVFEQYRSQGSRTYLPMPFAMVIEPSGTCWAFHVRTTRRTWYDVGARDPRRLIIEAELDRAAPEGSLEITLYNGTPTEILRAFLSDAGGAALPPEWVFRPWISANDWNTQARVMAEVERSLAEGIRVGVVVIEAWSDEATFVAFRDADYPVHADGRPHVLADFRFPQNGAWPDPKGLVDWLHGRGIRVLLWQVPLLKARPAPGSQARADKEAMLVRAYAVHDAQDRPYRNRGWWFPGALLPDWTNPEATSWWMAKRRYLVEEVGIDGFKTDGGEHAWGHDLRYADGTRGDETNNRYPVLYGAAYHGLQESLGRKPVTFSRAGFTGAAGVPCHWAGDEASTWEAFRASITAGLTAATSGVFFWSWDLAGFSGDIPTAELYLRATAAACFSPIMQYHSEFNHQRRPSRDRTPWNIADRTGDERVIPIFRRYATLRERLLPYIKDQAARSVATGAPLMRPLFFEWPAEPLVWRFPLQYLFGADLLVAPVLEPGVAEWCVFIPEGRWIHAWTRESYDGPSTCLILTPIESVPVLVRETDRAEPLLGLLGTAVG